MIQYPVPRESTPVTWTLPSVSRQTGVAKGGVRVGILALQGDFLEHGQVLEHLGVAVQEVRLPRDLEEVEALILPGGESTTMARLLDIYALREPLQACIQRGTPTWGTCAGLILLARELQEGQPQPLGHMDIGVARNAYGRQLDSFEADIPVPVLGEKLFHAVFIRAPAIVNSGEGVEVLARLADGSPVAVRQGRLLATAFHPELTTDTRFHSYFLDMATHGGRSAR